MCFEIVKGLLDERFELFLFPLHLEFEEHSLQQLRVVVELTLLKLLVQPFLSHGH